MEWVGFRVGPLAAFALDSECHPWSNRDMITMMKCGHAANAVDVRGNPVCVICAGIDHGASIPVEGPDLHGRIAECTSCDKTTDSDLKLAFFEYHGEGSRHATDICGVCRFNRDAHDPTSPQMAKGDRYEKWVERVGYHIFQPIGPADNDQFYDGCNGWE